MVRQVSVLHQSAAFIKLFEIYSFSNYFVLLAYTPNEEHNAPDVQKPAEIEKFERCLIYLMDIRESGLFDKYVKESDEPKEPVNDPMTPTDDFLLETQDRSPIEVPDSDNDEDEKIDNNDSRSNSSSSSLDDPQIVVVISDSE